MAVVLVGAHFAASLWALRAVFIVLGMFAGIQLPSSVATITATVKPDDWGTALSVQQMGPPLSLVVGPLIAAGMLVDFSWNTTLLWLAGLGVVLASHLPLRFRRDRRFPGGPAQPDA